MHKKKTATPENTTFDLLSITEYVRAHGADVCASRIAMTKFAAEVVAMIGALRTLILAGTREPLTLVQYDALREEWAAPLGYVAPSAPRGARGSDAMRAHTARDVYFSKTLWLTRLSPDEKRATAADARMLGQSLARAARVAPAVTADDDESVESKPDANVENGGNLPTLPAIVVVALLAARRRGVSNASIVNAIDALK